MSSIVFRSEAEADLRAIIAYYEEIDKAVAARIGEDIARALDLLQRYPEIGAPVPQRPFRRIVSNRFKFKLAYLIESERIVILGIFRFQDRES